MAETPGHVVHIVRFSSAQGIVRLRPIAIEDFQVHGMKCGATSVELQAWSARYSIDFTDTAAPVVRTSAVGVDALERQPTTNLGHWAKAGVLDLEGDGAAGEFQLVIARISRGREGGIEHYTFTSLIRRDPRPGADRVLASERLFEGVFLETVDDRAPDEL